MMFNNSTSLKRKFFLFALSLFTVICSVKAQFTQNIVVGTGTTTNTATGYPCPMQDLNQGSRAQYLFKASELKALGMDSGYISTISFNAKDLGGFAGLVDSFAIKIGTTTANVLTATAWLPSGATVFGPYDVTVSVGSNNFILNTPFFWNGIDNLIIEPCNGAAAPNTISGNALFYYSNAGFVASHTRAVAAQGNLCDSNSVATSTVANNRPNIIFEYTPKLECTGAPLVGNVTASILTATPCQDILLSAPFVVPVASGYMYQWYASVSGGVPTAIGSPSPELPLIVRQNETTVYSLQVICTLPGGGSTFSNSVTVTSPNYLSGIYTIDKTQPASLSNYISFTAAYNAIKNGVAGPVTFNVVPGTGPYTEQLIINGNTCNTSPTNLVVFNGNGNTITSGNLATANEKAVIKLKGGASYFVFDSLIIDASQNTTATSSVGVQLVNKSSFNVFKRCTIISTKTGTLATGCAGVAIGGVDGDVTSKTKKAQCAYNVFDHNTVIGGVYGFIMVDSLSTPAASVSIGNSFTNNNVQDFYRYGFYVNAGYQTNIEHNTITRPTRTTVGTDCNGIYLEGQNDAVNIARNRILHPYTAMPTTNVAFNGINLNNTNPAFLGTLFNYVYNNLIAGVTSVGIQNGILNTTSSNVSFYFNTISLDDTTTAKTSTVAGVTKGYNQPNAANLIDFQNNLVTVTRTTTGPKFAIYIGGAVIPSVLDYNNYYIQAPTSNSNNIAFFNSNRPTLASWKAATGKELNSINIYPFYNNATIDDYTPVNGGANDKGNINALINVPVDIDSIVRPAYGGIKPDIGAIEFLPKPCNGIIVYGYSIVNGSRTPPVVCQGSEIGLNLNITTPYGLQAFQWQSAVTPTGTWTDIGTPLLSPDTTLTVDTTLYYRCKVSCSSLPPVYSDTVQQKVFRYMESGAHTIDTNGVYTYDTLSGKPGGNFRSFRMVKDSWRCGITGSGNLEFNVQSPLPTAPVYNEQLIIDSVKGANITRQIVFNGNGNTISSATTANERGVIKLNGADFINFDSLTIDASSNANNSYAVHILNNADSNSFTRCKMIVNATANSANLAGVVINASANSTPNNAGNALCDGNSFIGNTITGGYYGACFTGSATSRILNNIFKDNKVSEFYAYGLYLGGSENTLIEHNTFSRPTRTNANISTTLAVTAISVNLTPSNTDSILRNRITNLFGGMPGIANTNTVGIEFKTATADVGFENVVANNLMYNLNGVGFIKGLSNETSNNVQYYHNTISLDNPGVITNTVATGFVITATPTLGNEIRFVNNLITINRGGTGKKYAMNVPAFAFDNSTIICDYNNYYVALNAKSTGYVGKYGTTDEQTLAAWQQAPAPTFTPDLASRNFDPIYADSANGNLAPQSLLLKGFGDPGAGITNDIDGNVRPTIPPYSVDMGAYEFTLPPCPSPMFAGKARVTPNIPTCLDVPIVLNLDTLTRPKLGRVSFQWQYAAAQTGPFSNLGPTQYDPRFDTVTTIKNWYRCMAICGTDTAYSDTIQKPLSNTLPGGTYTIDPRIPQSPYPYNPGNNFQTFDSAIIAMQCGIAGQIIFNVAPVTFTEQITVPVIAGADPINNVIFQGDAPLSTTTILDYSGQTVAKNYTLKYDSAKNVTFRNLQIKNSSASANKRVVVFARGSYNDSLVGCSIITTGAGALTTNAGVYVDSLNGKNISIKGNDITGASYGIYLTGSSATKLANAGHLIDGNYVHNAGGTHGIAVQYVDRIIISNNKVDVDAGTITPRSGIYANYVDSVSKITGNLVNIFNNSTPANLVNGISITNTRAIGDTDALVLANNTIKTGASVNQSAINGYYISVSGGINFINNVAQINTSGLGYGVYTLNNVDNINYFNNTLQIDAGTAASVPFYFKQNAIGSFYATNNIFSNKIGGVSMYLSNPTYILPDYNLYYSTGTNIIQSGAPVASYSSIVTWRNAFFSDLNSIVYTAALDNELKPDLNNPDVWAIHGRGTQIIGNNFDHDNKYRPTSTFVGVPDLGAYEFYPNVDPTVLNPLTLPGGEQAFMYGTDTVMKFKWLSAAPTTPVTLKRYSGVVPQGITTSSNVLVKDSMFFYNKVEIAGGGNYSYVAKNFFIDPWMGSITQPSYIGFGKTLPPPATANTWDVTAYSQVRVDVDNHYFFDTLSNFWTDKYTGLINVLAPPVIPAKDTSNEGKEFWVAYQKNQGFNGGANSQDMILYLSARQTAARVSITIRDASKPGKPVIWRNDTIVPANSVVASKIIPKSGAADSRMYWQGKYSRAINIKSNVNIAAYAHQYDNSNSGATMLMPTGVYGYEYYALTKSANWFSDDSVYSLFFVVADKDNTLLEITPSVQTQGKPANKPFKVSLNRGQVYQVLGQNNGGTSLDVTGSIIKSIPNANGQCFPVAVFSGASRTGIGCGGGAGGSGDVNMQQIFPYQAWGKRYLTFPAQNSTTPMSLGTRMTNIYRVMVKDPTTVVKLNGTVMTGGNGRYYEFESGVTNEVTSDKPVMVAMFMSSSGDCPNTGGDGDPEMFYISPLKQAIKSAGFYKNTVFGISESFMTIVMPTNGRNNLKVDGILWTSIPAANRFEYPHTTPGYTVFTRRWAAIKGQSTVSSDSAFTGLVYGLGSVESYGYNVGTLVKNLLPKPDILIDSVLKPYTCPNTPFSFSVALPYSNPTSITFNLSAVPYLTPNSDVTLSNPIPFKDTTYPDGEKLYFFTLPNNYVFSQQNINGYIVKYSYVHPDIESCDHTTIDTFSVKVNPSPVVIYNIKPKDSACVGNTLNFSSSTGSGVKAYSWIWKFHDGTSVTDSVAAFTYNNAGTFYDTLRVKTADGCRADSVRKVFIAAYPTLAVLSDSVEVCSGTDTTLKVLNPDASIIYNWYTTASGGSPVYVGANLSLTNITSTATYYVEAVSTLGCGQTPRKKVQVVLTQLLAAPQPVVSAVSANAVSFSWPAVPGATQYEVSVNGQAFVSTGTTANYTVSGLGLLDTASIIVRVSSGNGCQTNTSLKLGPICTNSSAAIITDSVATCTTNSISFTVQSPDPTLTYNWYSSVTGGTLNATGTTYTINNPPAGINTYYVEQINPTTGCVGNPRTKAVVNALAPLAKPVVTVKDSTNSSITFTWAAVSGATKYYIYAHGSSTPTDSVIPPQPLVYTISGLGPLQSDSIIVQAAGALLCQSTSSNSIRTVGCTAGNLVVNPTAVDTCVGYDVTFRVLSPNAAFTYNWYDAAVGGNLVNTADTFKVNNSGAANHNYYVQQTNTSSTCTNPLRTVVSLNVRDILGKPVVVVVDSSANYVKFAWAAVTGATGYEISLDTGKTWISVSTALSYTVNNMLPNSYASILVRAVGILPCQLGVSDQVIGHTLKNDIFIPNSFNLNSANPTNRTLNVFGFDIKEIKFLVFNQWGEKIRETNLTGLSGGGPYAVWDGIHGGKQQPSGVYMYVCQLLKYDGKTVQKTGSINLIR